MKHFLFVYGTLMKGHCNDYYLREQKYLGIGRLKDYEMYHVSTYPGIVEDEGGYVVGELYEIDEKVLKSLDIVENEGDLFVRKIVKVTLDCEFIETYVYIWNREINAKMHKVVDMPWQPSKNDPCRSQLNPLSNENPFETAIWPIVVQSEDGNYFESCTIRGAIAAIIGNDYLENKNNDQDWQARVKYSFDHIMTKHTNLHVVIHDQKKGVIAENCSFEEEQLMCNTSTMVEFVHIESERAFIYSLVRLGNAIVYEREDECYFSKWRDDGNNPIVTHIVQNGKYINIKEYDLEALTTKTWTEL